MDAETIRRRLRATGRRQSALARHMKISADSMSRLVQGKRKIAAEEVPLIESFFDGEATEPQPVFQTINVYGYAAAGSDGRIAMADDRVIDRVEIPYGLVRGEAFGVRVAGDSMEPRLFSGEVVIVERNLPPARGGDCVVEFTDGTALVKTYRGQRDGQVFLQQYNPEDEVRVDATKVAAIHAVRVRR